MKKVGRTLASAATVGLALVVTGCSSNVIGADGPQPGVAAQVEDTEITLDELTEVVDGLCTLQEADPSAASTSRAYAQAQILQAWVGALVAIQYAEDEGLEVSAPDSGLELSPGWDDVDEDDADSLRSYVDAFVLSAAIQQETEETPDLSGYDVTINPRFDVKFEDSAFEPAGTQLSVPVSKEAEVDNAAPTNEQLLELPDEELCGKRPAPQVEAPPVPMG